MLLQIKLCVVIEIFLNKVKIITLNYFENFGTYIEIFLKNRIKLKFLKKVETTLIF